MYVFICVCYALCMAEEKYGKAECHVVKCKMPFRKLKRHTPQEISRLLNSGNPF